MSDSACNYQYEPNESPSPQESYEFMDRGIPYTAGELAEAFGVSRSTMLRILQRLHKLRLIEKKIHLDNQVSWWKPK